MSRASAEREGREGAAVVFLVLLIPVLVMVFALLMERLEYRLQRTTMSEQDVEDFFDDAQPDEVNTFIKEGWTRALSRFRLRRRASGSSWRKRLFGSHRHQRTSTSRHPDTATSGEPHRAPGTPGT